MDLVEQRCLCERCCCYGRFDDPTDGTKEEDVFARMTFIGTAAIDGGLVDRQQVHIPGRSEHNNNVVDGCFDDVERL